MPAIITHAIFAGEAASSLEGDILASDQEIAAFTLANQGPDPLFFRFRTSPEQMKASHQLASRLHDIKVTGSLENLRAAVEQLPGKDQVLGHAWALGYLSHYMLDHTAHPLVFAEQDEIITEDETLAHSGSAVHGVIESDIDSAYLDRYRHATTEEQPPATFLHYTDDILRVAGILVANMALDAFNQVVSPKEYGQAVLDMKFLYEHIEPLGSPVSELVRFFQTTKNSYSQVQSLCHRPLTWDRCPWLNLEHYNWTSPFTGKQSRASFPDLFQQALEDFPKAARTFQDGGDLAQVTNHLNFSGKPLDPENEMALLS